MRSSLDDGLDFQKKPLLVSAALASGVFSSGEAVNMNLLGRLDLAALHGNRSETQPPSLLYHAAVYHGWREYDRGRNVLLRESRLALDQPRYLSPFRCDVSCKASAEAVH